MPSKERDRDEVEVVGDAPREKRRSSKIEKERDRDRDRDRDKERDKEKDREHHQQHRPSRSSKLRTTDSETSSHRKRRTKDKEKDRDRDRERDRVKDGDRERVRTKDRTREKDKEKDQDRVVDADAESEMTADLVPEMSRVSRASRPYSSFSKAHSRESIYSREDLAAAAPSRRTDPLTPEPTDLGAEADGQTRSKSADSPGGRKLSSSARKAERPPSPPETNLSSELKEPKEPKEPEEAREPREKRLEAKESRVKRSSGSRSGTPTSNRSSRERDSGLEERPRSRTSWVSRLTTTTSKQDDKSRVSTTIKASSQASQASQATSIPTAPKNPSIETVQEEAADSPSGIRRAESPTSSAPASVVKSSSKRTVSRPMARPEPLDVDFSPPSAQDSSPKTPVATPQFPPPPPMMLPQHEKQPPSQNIPQHLRFGEPIDVIHSDKGTPQSADFGPPPAPPPPPPLHIQEVPKVNYLTQNGGLPKPVSKYFLDALPRQNGTRPSNPPLSGAETLFAPFFNLLDQYQTVLDNQGSIAVATGHKTIARRILDRLDNVFTRDLPADGCNCVICENERPLESRCGLGWGEVLERYKGENPPWPPFDLASLGSKAIEESLDVPPRPESPVKMDPDIAEEFRGHYLRQSKKVRAAVDKWLTSCAEAPHPPPQEVDDETLTFAILTNLDQYHEQPYFNAILSGSRELRPAMRAPTPATQNGRKPRQDFLVRTGLSLPRWYGLAQAPRDAETAVYLIKNRGTHDLLRTVGDINPSEWELLISGRFDGFLWSGVDDVTTTTAGGNGGTGGGETLTPIAELSRGATPASGFFPSPGHQQQMRAGTMSPGGGFPFSPSRGPTPFGGASRGPTPFGGLSQYSRGPTPASFVSMSSSIAGPTSTMMNPGVLTGKTAVTLDEELEVQTLAEVERNIHLGMEALEDAFEALHQRAEAVRTALRQRNAGLQMGLRRHRYPGGAGGISVPSSGGSAPMADGTSPHFPRFSSGTGGYGGGQGEDETYNASYAASESDWGADEFAELRPDDSASNVASSSSRLRRPKRRNERRTPAPIEDIEEEEEGQYR